MMKPAINQLPVVNMKSLYNLKFSKKYIKNYWQQQYRETHTQNSNALASMSRN